MSSDAIANARRQRPRAAALIALACLLSAGLPPSRAQTPATNKLESSSATNSAGEGFLGRLREKAASLRPAPKQEPAQQPEAIGFKLPEPVIVRYEPAERDPFISSQAPETLVARARPRILVMPEPAVGEELARVSAEVAAIAREKLRVHGISISPPANYALVNRQIVQAGDELVFDIPEEVRTNFVQLAELEGLKTRMTPDGEAVAKVSEVQAGGVSFVIAGLKEPVEIEFNKNLDTRRARPAKDGQSAPPK